MKMCCSKILISIITLSLVFTDYTNGLPQPQSSILPSSGRNSSIPAGGIPSYEEESSSDGPPRRTFAQNIQHGLDFVRATYPRAELFIVSVRFKPGQTPETSPRDFERNYLDFNANTDGMLSARDFYDTVNIKGAWLRWSKPVQTKAALRPTGDILYWDASIFDPEEAYEIVKEAGFRGPWGGFTIEREKGGVAPYCLFSYEDTTQYFGVRWDFGTTTVKEIPRRRSAGLTGDSLIR